ncbi:MAG TPA: M67 family metallopeptidase [Vicinamibacterales bacterium]|nr:M67 family metallopeptidase [Vicinamibacterales bacterium]
MSDELRIAASAWDAILAHADSAWPDECCGLLLGQGMTIEGVRPARNIAREPRRRFLIDPADHFSALRDARVRGRTVLGAYHSHPHGEPRPSETDIAEAVEDGQFIHVIAIPAREDRPAAIAAYCLTPRNFVPLRLVRVP